MVESTGAGDCRFPLVGQRCLPFTSGLQAAGQSHPLSLATLSDPAPVAGNTAMGSSRAGLEVREWASF